MDDILVYYVTKHVIFGPTSTMETASNLYRVGPRRGGVQVVW